MRPTESNAVREAVVLKPKSQWKSQDAGDARSKRHRPKKAAGPQQLALEQGIVVTECWGGYPSTLKLTAMPPCFLGTKLGNAGFDVCPAEFWS